MSAVWANPQDLVKHHLWAAFASPYRSYGWVMQLDVSLGIMTL